jgi:hypothetical protein
VSAPDSRSSPGRPSKRALERASAPPKRALDRASAPSQWAVERPSASCPRWLALALFALVALSGCTPPLYARAPVLYPARVPIRSFPSILLAGNVLPEGDLADALRAHLAKDGKLEAKRVEVADLESMREVGSISPLTLVVVIAAGLYNDVQEDWQLMPVQSCDYVYGCFTQYQNVYTAMPQVVGEATVTVYEGPTARTLQTATFDAAVYEEESAGARKRAFDQLALQVVRAVDVIQSETKVELEPVDEHPVVSEALGLIQRGDWQGGRALLEQAAQALGGTRRSLQARVWYDLAIARWYAAGPDGLTQPVYESAARALKLAIETSGSERYRKTEQRLALARQRQQILEQQRSVARENYALQAGSGTDAGAPGGASPPSPPTPGPEAPSAPDASAPSSSAPSSSVSPSGPKP